MSAVVEIGMEVRGLCAQLGVDPDDVLSIDLNPKSATVKLVKRNDRGQTFQVRGELQTETRSFEVSLA